MDILQLDLLILPHTARSVWIWSVLDVAASAGYLGGFLHLGANQECPMVSRKSISLRRNEEREASLLSLFVVHDTAGIQCNVQSILVACHPHGLLKRVLVNVDSICGYSIDVEGLYGINRFKVAQRGGLQVMLNVRVLTTS